MTKKIVLVILCIIIISACGRKNDPKYEAKVNLADLKTYELR